MFIAGANLVSPLGLDAVSACAAKRAGASALSDLPYLDNAGEPVVGAVVPGLDRSLTHRQRLMALLAACLGGMLESSPASRWDTVPLLVCLPEAGRPGVQERAAESVLRELTETLGRRFHPSWSDTIMSGHTAGFEALHRARRMLASGAVQACLVCGADSLVNAATLAWLDRDYRLKTPANRDGVVPGEASAGVLLQAEPGGDAVTAVSGLGFLREEGSLLADRPLRGHGLAGAVREALVEARLGLHDIDLRISDVSGELYGFKELPLVEGRLMRVVRKDPQPLWHWAEAVGDIGAAAGLAQLVWVDQAFRRRYAPGSRVLCMTSALDGRRAAAVLQRKAG